MQGRLSSFQDPILTVEVLVTKRNELNHLTKDIINKPKSTHSMEEKTGEKKNEVKGRFDIAEVARQRSEVLIRLKPQLDEIELVRGRQLNISHQ